MAGAATKTGHGGRALCGAKKKQGEGTCTQAAGWGVPGATTGPCKLHGGATRNHKKAAEVELAKQAVKRYGLPVDIDPSMAMRQAVAYSYGQVLYMRAEVAALAQPWQDDKPHVAWVMLKAEEKHHADVCRDAVKAGVERRTVELMEDMARQVVAGFSHFARLMGLDPASPQVREAGRQALQLVAGERA